jgi:hypothetical protein
MRRRVAVPASRHLRPGRERRAAPGERLPALVLARAALGGEAEVVFVECETGALLRWRHGSAAADGLEPLQVVEVEIGADDEPFDPSRPEAVTLARPPVALGRPRRRAARHLLARLSVGRTRPLVLPGGAASAAYEDLPEGAPSVIVVANGPGQRLYHDGAGLRVPVGPPGRSIELRVADARLEAATARWRPGEVRAADVRAALGGDPRYLVVGLGPPDRRQVPQLVLGLLPSP